MCATEGNDVLAQHMYVYAREVELTYTIGGNNSHLSRIHHASTASY